MRNERGVVPNGADQVRGDGADVPLASEQSPFRLRLLAVDPVEIGGSQLIMGLDGAAMLRGLGELELRLGSAFEIFLFFVRHLAWIGVVVTDRYQNGRAAAAVPRNRADPGC